MKLYNSLSNKVEEFKSIEQGKVSMYVCGPTVYNYPHIGNARPIAVFDTLRRLLTALGYEVTMVSNYTDIDDKIINKAVEEGITEEEVAEKFTKIYNENRRSINAIDPTFAPKVTETMPEIITLIADLIEDGYAYERSGDVYFRVGKINNYGQLSNQKLEDLMVGARIQENLDKENALDFTLWKKTKSGVSWKTPWSSGRPGWHSECVVMIQNQFNKRKIDIHGGGMDLKFPHHENEIAQSEALCGHSLANYWVHNGMINIEGEKMSKSLGNVIWVGDFVEKFGGNTVRWFLNSAHYRSPLNLSMETVETAQIEVEKISNTLRSSYIKLAVQALRVEGKKNEFYDKFIHYLEDDLNTPNAISVVFEITKKLNQSLRMREIDLDEIAELTFNLELMLELLGIFIPKVEMNEEQRSLYKQWEVEKKNKNFEVADELRKKLDKDGLI